MEQQNMSHLLFWGIKRHVWNKCVLNLSLGTVLGLAKNVLFASMGHEEMSLRPVCPVAVGC